jgi:flagellar assembly factor FliW
MKIVTESQKNKDVWVKPMEFRLTKGLVGFPDENEFELLVNTEELPFMWIRSTKNHELGFIVLEPAQFLNDYEIEIADDDAEELGITSFDDALVLNIVTIRGEENLDSATANLVGPIVMNRNSQVGKQVIVSNHMKYSTKHPILSSNTNG